LEVATGDDCKIKITSINGRSETTFIYIYYSYLEARSVKNAFKVGGNSPSTKARGQR
jgi:hypothetical protein